MPQMIGLRALRAWRIRPATLAGFERKNVCRVLGSPGERLSL